MRYALLLASCLFLPAPVLAQRLTAPKLDLYGDPLPPGAVLRLGTTRLQASAFSRRGFAWAPDGKAIVTTKHGTAFFWDMADGHCRETLLVPIDANYHSGLALSRDGKRLVCADRLGAIASWDLETSQLTERKRAEPRSESEHRAIAISSDGKTLATIRESSGDTQLQLWNPATCELKRTVKIADSSESNLVFSPVGALLAFGRGNSILLYDTSGDAEPLAIPLPQRSQPYSLAFTADGRRLVASLTVPVDDPPLKKPQWRTELALLDVPTREQIASWAIHPGIPPGCSVACSPVGDTLVSVHPDRIQFWDLAKQAVVRSIDGLRFRNAMWAQVAIDPTGKYLAVDDHQGYVQIWDFTTGKPHLTTGASHAGSILAAAWSPDGRTIATGSFTVDDVRLWDALTGRVVRRLDKVVRSVRDIRFSNDGLQVIVLGNEVGEDVASTSAVVRWHDTASGKLNRELRDTGKAWRFALSPDESQVAVDTYQDDRAEGDATIRVIDCASGRVISSFKTFATSTESMAWSPDAKSIYQSTRKGLTQFEAGSGRVLLDKELRHVYRDPRTGELHPSGINRSIFYRDAHEVLTAGDLPEIHGWSTVSGERHWTLAGGKGYIRGLALSPDESIVACIDAVRDTKTWTLRLFQIGQQRQLAQFDLGRESCDRLVFSPDGSRVLVGFYDGTALVYDVTRAASKVD